MLKRRAASVVLFAPLLASCQPQFCGRLNSIQIIGTHNSYHAGIPAHEMELYRRTHPAFAAAVDYKHPSLTAQLDDGVRQLELDVYADLRGGLYAHPMGPDLVAKAGLPPDPPFDPLGLMMRPGFKVFHMQDVDYRSNCQPFVACLMEIRGWLRLHRDSLPVFVLVENKDDRGAEFMTKPEPTTVEVLDRLDDAIRSVFRKSELLTPDDVSRRHASLEEAVKSSGWPRLKRLRGKVVFLLDQQRLAPIYSINHPSLRGRVAFTNSKPGLSETAFVEVNDPQADPELIPKLVDCII
jgi:hypothetical protein